MPVARSFIAAFALLALLTMAPGRAKAQGAIGIQPNVGQLNDGVTLNVTPAVTADRRFDDAGAFFVAGTR